MIDRIHHVGIVVHSADDALGFFRDTLGLTVTEDRVVEEQGVRGVLLALGENEIELLQPTRDDTGVARFLESRGETLHHICFNTDDVDAELARLKDLGIELIDETSRDGLAGRIGFIHPKAMHGVLVELATPPAGAHVSHEKGFDHLAVTVADYETARNTWKQAIGLDVVNEIRPEGRDMLIAQMPSGQCMIELIAATSPDSPIAKRVAEEGERASSMVAIEVADLDAEVAKYRAKGFELPDPAVGPLPNSRTSRIDAAQSFGLAIQLIQFDN
ncbi:MAG: methylmalonyl-CoA epimerase [Dehalococcoidia bacterium]